MTEVAYRRMGLIRVGNCGRAASLLLCPSAILANGDCTASVSSGGARVFNQISPTLPGEQALFRRPERKSRRDQETRFDGHHHGGGNARSNLGCFRVLSEDPA